MFLFLSLVKHYNERFPDAGTMKIVLLRFAVQNVCILPNLVSNLFAAYVS